MREFDIQRLAEIEKIELRGGEAAEFERELTQKLDFVDRIFELDTDGVEPTEHIQPFPSALRADEPRECLNSAEVLTAAPKAEGLLFAVPPSFGEGAGA